MRVVTLLVIFIVQQYDKTQAAQLGETLPKTQTTNEQPPKISEGDYLKKVCANEPTCDLLTMVPENLHKIPRRDCMCDAECSMFGDCCLDSKYYDKDQNSRNHLNFYCAETAGVLIYIKNTCLSNFTDLEVVNKCLTANSSFQSTDRDLVARVTDPINNITYANKYCARCNRVDKYVSWSVSYTCRRRNSPRLDVKLLEDTSKLVKLNQTTGAFYADLEGVRYDCPQHTMPPSTIKLHELRNCVPLIASCQNITDKEIVDKCESHMSIVYRGETAYRNKFCAECNGVSRKAISGCIQPSLPPGAAFSVNWETGDKARGSGACSSSFSEAINQKFSFREEESNLYPRDLTYE